MLNLFDTLQFKCGQSMKNRFMLAPLTNTQSHEDGTLSEDEYHWLTMRAKGGFGLTMTCASHVQENGKGFPGQLGIFSDKHIAGHTKLATAIKNEGSLAVIQLHHAGIRSPKDLVNNDVVGPSNDKETGARALALQEVHQLRDDFIRAAARAKQCGYNGVEIHGAHGYIICQFLSSEYNQREDDYGGNLENRSRLLFEITEGVRKVCGADFLVGIRLSPERFGMRLNEIKTICIQLVNNYNIDFLDISLWDCFKKPEEIDQQDMSLLEHFLSLDYKGVLLTVAGQIRTAKDVKKIILSGVDFVTIGRAAILHHDFPLKVKEHENFKFIKNDLQKKNKNYIFQNNKTTRLGFYIVLTCLFIGVSMIVAFTIS